MAGIEGVKLMSSHPVLRLEAGSLELQIVPARGGAIANFTCVAAGARIPILRPTRPGRATVHEMASFPLVPFANRIRSGRFEFCGREVAMAPNLPPDPHPLHGQGWLNAWEVGRSSAGEAELIYRHDAGQWPWDYEARQLFVLDGAGLGIRLGCRNLSGGPMPCGLGLHPYFPCSERTLLDADVEAAWMTDDEVLPVERVAATGRFDLRRRPICGQDLDHGFDGWSGFARIATRGVPFRIELSSPQARRLQLYSPPGGGFFAAEPVTHRAAALNEPEECWERLGVRILEPGEEMALDVRIALVASSG